MMKNLSIGLLVVIAGILVSGCSVYVIEGSGNVVEEVRPVEGFSRVDFAAYGKLTITQGDAESLVIETDDNLLQYIKTDVVGDTLEIKIDESAFSLRGGDAQIMKPTDTLNYRLMVDDLSSLEVSGAGLVEVESLDTDQLDVLLSGAGDISFDALSANNLDVTLTGAGGFEASGDVVNQSVEVTGLGSYRAYDLQSQTAFIEITGAGGANVWVTDRLDVTVTGAGDVNYYGSPELSRDVTGGGVVTNKGTK
ncbi:MAG: DUF2807 domain-containing protein [Anaerolineae bacterium]|nr:DUF2807 domain-containing protein [Anaerolineae bacterium]